MRGDEVLAERTVHLGSFDLGVLVGEELAIAGATRAYEDSLRAAVEILEPVNVLVYSSQKSSPRPPRASSRPGPRRQSRSAGRFAVVLAGGSTPKATYEMLARDYVGRIDWSRVHVFFGDERSVPPHHEDLNYKMASEVLLYHVPVAKRPQDAGRAAAR